METADRDRPSDCDLWWTDRPSMPITIAFLLCCRLLDVRHFISIGLQFIIYAVIFGVCL